MKYAIALASVLLMFGLIWASMTFLRQWVTKQIRQAKVEAMKRGDIPAGANLESDDFNLEMYDYEKIAISVLNLWTNIRALVVLLLGIMSLAIAWML